MNEIKNVIWILVDSVRNYHTDQDDRGRLDIMDKFAKRAIEFKTAITSAPSTVMSVSAMMTGVPAIFHSRTYSDFNYSSAKFSSLPKILHKNDYNLNSIIFFPEGRKFLKPLFLNISENFWPQKSKKLKFWSNEIVYNAATKVLNNINRNHNKFLYVHFNCRHDPNTSEIVEKFIKNLEEQSYFENSIIILNSDHGYPDSSRNISNIDKIKFGHDLILTDDNILTPLFFYYPDCNSSTIKFPVSTLDIMPTIIDLLEMNSFSNHTRFPIHGKSLLKFIINDKRVNDLSLVRTDNRFIFQDNRVASLRDSNYKYIYFYETSNNELYDLNKDSEESQNLIENLNYSEKVKEYSKILKEQDYKIYLFHKDYIKMKLVKILENKEKVAIVGEAHITFYKMIIEVMIEAGIDKIYVDIYKYQNTNSNFYDYLRKNNKIEQLSKNNIIDSGIGIFTNKNPISRYKTYKKIKKISPNNYCCLNYNIVLQHKPYILIFLLESIVNVCAKIIFNPSKIKHIIL